jgi:hypothetical protein
MRYSIQGTSPCPWPCPCRTILFSLSLAVYHPRSLVVKRNYVTTTIKICLKHRTLKTREIRHTRECSCFWGCSIWRLERNLKWKGIRSHTHSTYAHIRWHVHWKVPSNLIALSYWSAWSSFGRSAFQCMAPEAAFFSEVFLGISLTSAM